MKHYQQLTEEKGLVLVSELSGGLDVIIGDQRRYEQVLLNFLSNAIKFTDSGKVSVSVQPNGEGMVETVVCDTGIGMKQEDQGFVFNDFQQIDNGTNRKHEGTGLGLSVSRRLVEMMGGRIWFSSTYGEGSTFGFTVPSRAENRTER